MFRLLTVLLVCWSWAVAAPAGQAAPDGAEVYAASCAQCHDDTRPRMPSRDALRERSAQQIQTALVSGAMRQFGASLTAAERRAVAEFLAGESAGTLDSALAALPSSAYCTGDAPADVNLTVPAWNGWGVDLANRRFQPTPGLTADEVPRLRLQWAFGFPDVTDAGSQATIVAGRALIGTRTGLVYSLDAATGCVHWMHEAPATGHRQVGDLGRPGRGRWVHRLLR